MISVVQDIISPSNSNNDRQQTIDALFDMVPNTNTVEERPSGDDRSSLWKIAFLAKKIISFGLSIPVLLILHVRSLLATLQFSVEFTPTGLQVQSLPPPGDTKKISKSVYIPVSKLLPYVSRLTYLALMSNRQELAPVGECNTLKPLMFPSSFY